MSRWIDPQWYRHVWRRRVPPEAKFMVAASLAVAVLVGGYFASDGLTSATTGTSSGSDAYILQTKTVTRVVTLKKNGRTIVRRYPVIRTVRVRAKTQTIHDFRTVTTPTGVTTIPVVRVRRVSVTKTVSHVVTDVVTKNGKTRTIVSNHPVTVPVTVQQATPAQTVVATVASPPVTVLNTETNTVTETATTTVVVTTVDTVTVTDSVTTTVVVTT